MEPRYAALARQIAQHITEGQHPVGSLLPGEVELAELHGVSRATVRSALQQLQDMGLISRRKRAGTRVEASQPPAGYAPSLGTIEDLVQYAAEAERGSSRSTRSWPTTSSLRAWAASQGSGGCA